MHVIKCVLCAIFALVAMYVVLSRYMFSLWNNVNDLIDRPNPMVE